MPDTKLLVLGRQFDRAFVRFEKASSGARAKLSAHAYDEALCELIAPLNEIMDLVANSRAATIEGLVFKARVATKFGGAIDTKISDSIVTDLLVLNAASDATTVVANSIKIEAKRRRQHLSLDPPCGVGRS